MAKGKRDVRGFVERLVEDKDVPSELLCGGCFIEIRGRNGMTVRGCRRVVKYSPDEVVLKMKRETIVIGGKRLRCLTYLSGAIVIEGMIDALGFSRREGREANE